MKKIIIPGVLLVIILASSILVLSRFKNNKQEVKFTPSPTSVMPTISDTIRVELTSQDNNRVVVLRISGIPGDMESIEYELTYLTGNNLPRGVLGKIMVEGKSELERKDIVLGTCSSGKCVYDIGVESIDLSLKFNSRSGVSVYQKTYKL